MGRASLISEDEEFLLVSSNNKGLSPSEFMDKKDPAKHNDGPSCFFFVVDDYKARCSETDLSAMHKRTDYPVLESQETCSSDSNISFHTRGGNTRGPGSSNEEIKESRKKGKVMYREMLKFVHNRFDLQVRHTFQMTIICCIPRFKTIFPISIQLPFIDYPHTGKHDKNSQHV